jgi:coenzyme F420 hydrogenase subunit beta
LPNRQTGYGFEDIDPRVCTLCGACASICPAGVIEVDGEGASLRGECIHCGLCYRFCPGREMDFEDASRTCFGSPPEDPFLGHYSFLGVAQATSREIRERGGSGGVVTALLTDLLAKGHIKGVVAVTMSEDSPWRCQASLLTTPEQVLRAAQSKYSMVSVDTLLAKVRKEGGPFAVVGLPCHIHGLRRLQRLGSYREAFPLAIGLFCGLNLRPTATEHLIRKLGFDKKEVTSLEYRGGSWPGGLLIRASDGREALIPKHAYDYVNLMYVPRRCLTCPDLTNELADISVGDVWLEQYRGGWSTVVGRSLHGRKVLKEAALDGVIRMEELGREQVLRSHAHLFAYKKQGYFVRRRLLRVPLRYTLPRPPIGVRRWLQEALLLAAILILSNHFVRGFVQRLPLRWLTALSIWGRKGATLSTDRGR